MRPTLIDSSNHAPLDARRWDGERMVDHLVESARGNLAMGRRLLAMGCAGFAAASAQLTMRLLASALLFEQTGRVYHDPRAIVADFRRVFEGHVPPNLFGYLEEGAQFEMHVDTADYHAPPTIDRARDEVTRAEEFLGDVVGLLGVPSGRASTP